jgi:hypothetical protein
MQVVLENNTKIDMLQCLQLYDRRHHLDCIYIGKILCIECSTNICIVLRKYYYTLDMDD